jgi:hypothetical protein
MTDQATCTPTDNPTTATADPATIETAAQSARDEIAKLKAKANETLRDEFQAIAEAARTAGPPHPRGPRSGWSCSASWAVKNDDHDKVGVTEAWRTHRATVHAPTVRSRVVVLQG